MTCEKEFVQDVNIHHSCLFIQYYSFNNAFISQQECSTLSSVYHNKSISQNFTDFPTKIDAENAEKCSRFHQGMVGSFSDQMHGDPFYLEVER